VDVHSDGPGRGSEFTIRLPLSQHQNPRAASTAVTPDRGPTARVLLIEDNDDARQTLRTLLEQAGHWVDDVADGVSGVARAETTKADIVLIDIGLPGMDGYEVARLIRAGRGPAPMLVAITGYGQADDHRRALEAGFDAHLTKPVSIDHLAQVLATLARGRRSGA
jgi:CheY-like chemotaxis protein